MTLAASDRAGSWTDYLPIAEHGIIGDLHSIALVGTDGADRLVLLPALRLAERLRRRSSTRIAAASTGSRRSSDEWVPKQLYLPDTNVLITRFLTAGGVGEVQDFMPIQTGLGPHRHRLIRRVLGVRGEMRFRVEVLPRFNFARDEHETIFHENGVALPLAGALARARDRDPARLPRRGRLRRVHAPAGRDGGVRARAGAGDVRAALVLRGRDARGVRADRGVLAPLARAVELLRAAGARCCTARRSPSS